MKLLVVITNYRVTHLTIDCLRSIADEVSRVPGIHVAVCENGTGDDSFDLIQRAISSNNWGSWCTLTVLQTNLEFTGGNNAIIRPALQSDDPPQYVFLLNADTIVLPECVQSACGLYGRPSGSRNCEGSYQEEKDGSPLTAAFRFPSPSSEFESALKLGIVDRALKGWVVAQPESGCALRDGLAFRRQHVRAKKGLRRHRSSRRGLLHVF